MTNYATLLRDHITLSCRSIDRIFLQAYVPKLQSVGQVCLFLNRQRGYRIPSSAAFGQIGEAYVAAIHRWAEANRVPIRYFAKGDNKEKIAEPLLRAAAEQGGDGKVVLIGIAQEKASAWRSWKKKGQEKARHPHMEWGRQMVFVNHFYFYCATRSRVVNREEVSKPLRPSCGPAPIQPSDVHQIRTGERVIERLKLR